MKAPSFAPIEGKAKINDLCTATFWQRIQFLSYVFRGAVSFANESYYLPERHPANFMIFCAPQMCAAPRSNNFNINALGLLK